jgi:hypothetical protein
LFEQAHHPEPTMISSMFFIIPISAAWLVAYFMLAIPLHETLARETDHGGLVVLGAAVVVAIIFTGRTATPAASP